MSRDAQKSNRVQELAKKKTSPWSSTCVSARRSLDVFKLGRDHCDTADKLSGNQALDNPNVRLSRDSYFAIDLGGGPFPGKKIYLLCIRGL